MSDSIDFKDAYFHISINAQSRKYLHFHVQGETYHSKGSIQGTTIWSGHSTHGIHGGRQRDQIDGLIQGYKNSAVPRRLAGPSQIARNLSPAYKPYFTCDRN